MSRSVGAPVPPDGVLAAVREWIWIPFDSEVLGTAEWMLLRHPGWHRSPAELMTLDPAADPARVVQEVLDRARELGVPRLTFWLRLNSPEEYVDLLTARGAVPDETLDVLARDLCDWSADPGPAPREEQVPVRWVDDLDSARHADRIDTDVFGGTIQDDEALRRAAAKAAADHAEGRGGRVLALVDGTPCGSGGLAVAPSPRKHAPDVPDHPAVRGSVARLWGGAVLEPARRRGAYAAMLAERLRYAVGHGATLALVKGRVQTSAPILRRAGFAWYGRERSFTVPLMNGG